MHSVYSDGAFPPEELARRARKAGVRLFSVTDHDGMGGDGEKRAAAERYGLLYVRGWEVSSYADCKVHVLGYGCATGRIYEEFLEERRHGALVRAQDMLAKANGYFRLNVTMDEVERFHLKKQAPLHTMHVVRAFAQRLGTGEGELYLSCFDKGMPAYSDLCRPAPEDAIDVIHALGGIAVLAHAGRIAKPFGEREELMDRLVSRGLDGIECFYTTHTAEETEYFCGYAERKGLFVTGGSDFHADDGRHLIGSPEFHADEKLLDALRIPF